MCSSEKKKMPERVSGSQEVIRNFCELIIRLIYDIPNIFLSVTESMVLRWHQEHRLSYKRRGTKQWLETWQSTIKICAKNALAERSEQTNHKIALHGESYSKKKKSPTTDWILGQKKKMHFIQNIEQLDTYIKTS